MKIVFLDAKSIGEDIDLSAYDALGFLDSRGSGSTKRGCRCAGTK